jgi:hypothetical protein
MISVPDVVVRGVVASPLSELPVARAGAPAAVTLALEGYLVVVLADVDVGEAKQLLLLPQSTPLWQHPPPSEAGQEA